MEKGVFFFMTIISVCLARLEEDHAPNNTTVNDCKIDKCFHKSEDYCPSLDNMCRCHQLRNCKKAAVCCNIGSQFQLNEALGCANVSASGIVEALHIRNATLDVLNVSQSSWRRLKYLTITDGNIKSVIGEFSKFTCISYLNLSSNNITNFEERSLVNLYNLSYLDLSHNNITKVPRFKKERPITLDISDNQLILCDSVLEALKRPKLHFNNENVTNCLSPKNFHWFKSTEIMPLLQLKKSYELERDCKKKLNCTCEAVRIDLLEGNPPVYAIAVDCSSQGLTTLPKNLPFNTVTLNISHNNITSLNLIDNDSSYLYLRQLDADYNQISSIVPLEGSKFIRKFVYLSLKHNKINSIPTYMLSNILDRNSVDRMVFLGYNSLHCDCNTAQALKVWLMTKTKQIPDYDKIYCSNMDATVINLSAVKLCPSQQDWTDYIYYIIALQVFLLVSLVTKVFYDYWIFKTAGYLPWPASKMPKMPCDWLCE